MKKTAKIISALLVLVMMLAQVVCVSAVTYPKVSISSAQTDHFERTVTISLRDAEEASYGWVKTYDKNGKEVSAEALSFSSGNDNYTVTLKVRPNDVAKVVFASFAANNTKLNHETYSVPSNGYYNPGSSSSSSSNGTYDGLKNSGNSGTTNYYYNYSNGTNVWDYYNPNAWTGYREDSDSKDSDSYRVTASVLNVRSGAGTRCGKVGALRRGDIVEVYDIEDGWAVIEFRGHLCFVSAQYLRKVK